MKEQFDWTYKAECERVVDGDTYDLRVDLGFGVQKQLRVRLLGIDTNETYGVPKESEEYRRGAEQARFVEEWFDEHDEIYIRTHKDEKGKYGRYLAEVIGDDGSMLSDCIAEEYPHTKKE